MNYGSESLAPRGTTITVTRREAARRLGLTADGVRRLERGALERLALERELDLLREAA